MVMSENNKADQTNQEIIEELSDGLPIEDLEQTDKGKGKGNKVKPLYIVICLALIALIGGAVLLNKQLELKELESLDLPVYEGETIVGREDDAIILEGSVITDELGEPILDESGEQLIGQVQVYQDIVTHEPVEGEDGVIYGD